MSNGLKIFFTVLIVFALVIAVPVMQVLTLTRLTVINPHFYARPMDKMYGELYDLAMDSMTHALSEGQDGLSDEIVDRLETAFRETIPPEAVSRLMEESVPQVLSYVLYGGEAPVIDYGGLVEDIRESLWDSGVLQDMLIERIRFQVDPAGITGFSLEELEGGELAGLADDLLFSTRFDSYYTSETREEALAVVYEAYLSAAAGGGIDLAALPFPDAVDFMPLDDAVQEMPFSSDWDSAAHEDFTVAVADMHYAMGIFRVVFWAGWMGVIVLLALLLLTWLRKPSVFMNITGGMLIADGVMGLLFALSCSLGGSQLIHYAQWGDWGIPSQYFGTIQTAAVAVLQPIARIALITGVLILVSGVTLLILAPIVKKKETAKEQIAA